MCILLLQWFCFVVATCMVGYKTISQSKGHLRERNDCYLSVEWRNRCKWNLKMDLKKRTWMKIDCFPNPSLPRFCMEIWLCIQKAIHESIVTNISQSRQRKNRGELDREKWNGYFTTMISSRECGSCVAWILPILLFSDAICQSNCWLFLRRIGRSWW